jgi:hypothetical protein
MIYFFDTKKYIFTMMMNAKNEITFMDRWEDYPAKKVKRMY